MLKNKMQSSETDRIRHEKRNMQQNNEKNQIEKVADQVNTAKLLEIIMNMWL